MKKYHFEIGIPTNARTKYGQLRLKYSNHAQKAAQDDRYGLIPLPETLCTDTAQVIEVEVDEEGITEKVLYRVALDDEKDLLLAVIPYKRFVKTVWINLRNDKHTTLKHWLYDKP